MVSWKRGLFLGLIDFFLINLGLYTAFFLRFDGQINPHYMALFSSVAMPFALGRLFFFWLIGLYKRLWGYASVGEFLTIVYAVSAGTMFNMILSHLMEWHVPLSIFAMSWMNNLALIGGSRMFWRLYRERFLQENKSKGEDRVLIVGAGDAGVMIAKELLRHGENVVGFLDDADHKQRQMLLGLTVLGRLSDLGVLVGRTEATRVVAAMPTASPEVFKQLINDCHRATVDLKVLPPIQALVDGSVTINSLREVQVEDLLGRKPVKVDMKSISGYLRGQVVMVTGAGGSIGSEICRQVARFGPKEILLLGHGENSIHEISLDLKEAFPGITQHCIIADVRDRQAINDVFRRFRPRVVFHAAAHKHVPLMENCPEEAVKTNVFGTLNVARAAKQFRAERFVFISTDKAVNPTSVMGATKRLGEAVALGSNRDRVTRYMAVRFGNVLDSRGSVVPLFKRQIARGGPVTVTHPDMRRYFMTIPEAVQLVVQAGAMGQGGEVFVLDMGEPVRIVDLAENLIRLSGLEPGRDIAIEFTGIRPGEKLFEELLTAEEGTRATINQRIFVASNGDKHLEGQEDTLFSLEKASESGQRAAVLALLHSLVPTYQRLEVETAAGSD